MTLPFSFDNFSHSNPISGEFRMSETMKSEILSVAPEQVVEFRNMFVNRKAHIKQSNRPGGKSGKHYYFLAEVKATKKLIPLELATIEAHLAGRITVGFYAISPKNQSCKWLAIDADYSSAIDDLKKLREAFAADGIEALCESSRRGGHLWIFNEEPLQAKMLRLYVLNKAKALGVPVKLKGDDDGIEIFPKQDMVGEGEFGNAIRAPFGIHRATMQRYWFEGAPKNLGDQLALIRSAKRLSKAQLEQLTAGLKPVESPKTKFVPNPAFNRGNSNLVVVPIGAKRKSGKNWLVACPVCDHGNRSRDFHLSVKIADPSVYRCWHDCSTEEIKRALGVDPRTRLQFAA
jgi:hypothetical protein